MNHMNHSVPICFTGEWWAHWICAGAICHNWNIPINIVTPSHGSVVCMFHECKDVKIILITNGWPENGIEITHYSSTQREDEDRNLIPIQGWFKDVSMEYCPITF